jgi:hypothetical protein
MDSETSVILRRPTTATKVAPRSGTAVEVMAPSRSSRTEGTAVFIGRASFHMVPAGHAARGSEAPDEAAASEAADQAATDEAAASAPALPATPRRGGIELEDAMTPLPMQMQMAVPTMRADAHARLKTSGGIPAGAVMTLFSTGDVTEPIQAGRPRAVRLRRPLVTGRTVRTILLALCAGATITLSAEAVMRRPARIATVRTLAAGTPPQVAVAPPVAAPAPLPVAATVVASTATAPPPETAPAAIDPVSARAPAPARGLHKRSRLRPAPTIPRPSAIATAGTAKTFATWVDPFVASEATGATAATKRSGPAAWVDPFAN